MQAARTEVARPERGRRMTDDWDLDADVRGLLVRGLDRALLEQVCKLYGVAVTQNDADAIERCLKGIHKAVDLYVALNAALEEPEEAIE